MTGSCAEGRRLTRASFEDAAPAILVESPLLDQAVSSPLRMSGSANTFEATFQVEIVDARGRVVAEDFVTATSGSGTRGTFEASLPFEVDRPGGKLVVYEASAKDGSRLHEVEIPLRLQP
ncbi:MAG: Gmad2 immunoglobulin-like domain-containing protein [Thermoleophilia bacterium]|nr:Gmad2 immunoglobulin-like domain-containing protein [Thermoleophilia bacterium]